VQRSGPGSRWRLLLQPRVAFPSCLLLAGLGALGVIYGQRLNSPPIRSDGVGYYLYLPAILIHHDPTFVAVARDHFNGKIPPWTGVKPWGDGTAYLDKYTAGVAVLLAPFFTLAYVIAPAGGFPRDGFSPPFQYAAASGALVFAVLGVYLLWRVLERHFSTWAVFLTTVAMVLGTNLFHYATYDAVFSHAFSFFLCSAFMFCLPRLFERGRPSDLLLVGAIAGLLVLVRPTNAICLLAGALYRPQGMESLASRLRFARAHLGGLAGGAALAASVVLIQVLYWKAVTGQFLVYSYQGEGFRFLAPQIAKVLFSARKGVFFWSPVLLLALGGLPALRRRVPEWFWPVAVILPLQVYLISSWGTWWFGGSFGHRGFVESIPLFALCLATLLDVPRSRLARSAVVAATVILSAYTFVLMVRYWQGIIPFDGATLETVGKAFGFVTK
jgi:hypothetical protein